MTVDNRFTGYLEVSQRYKVTYRRPGQRKDRTMVAVYLGWLLNGNDRDTSWSLRPAAGTSTMPESWIKSVFPTTEDISIGR